MLSRPLKNNQFSLLVVVSVVTSCHLVCWSVGDEVNFVYNPYLETEIEIISVTWSHVDPSTYMARAERARSAACVLLRERGTEIK